MKRGERRGHVPLCSECRMPEPAVMNCTEPRPSDSRVPMESSYGASACRVDNYVGDNLLGIARAARCPHMHAKATEYGTTCANRARFVGGRENRVYCASGACTVSSARLSYPRRPRYKISCVCGKREYFLELLPCVWCLVLHMRGSWKQRSLKQKEGPESTGGRRASGRLN